MTRNRIVYISFSQILYFCCKWQKTCIFLAKSQKRKILKVCWGQTDYLHKPWFTTVIKKCLKLGFSVTELCNVFSLLSTVQNRPKNTEKPLFSTKNLWQLTTDDVMVRFWCRLAESMYIFSTTFNPNYSSVCSTLSEWQWLKVEICKMSLKCE